MCHLAVLLDNCWYHFAAWQSYMELYSLQQALLSSYQRRGDLHDLLRHHLRHFQDKWDVALSKLPPYKRALLQNRGLLHTHTHTNPHSIYLAIGSARQLLSTLRPSVPLSRFSAARAASLPPDRRRAAPLQLALLTSLFIKHHYCSALRRRCESAVA